MSLKKKCEFLLSAFLLLFVISATHISASGGGEQLYKHGFIAGSNPNKMELNEQRMLTREQLALLILELNGLREEAKLAAVRPIYSDWKLVSEWSKPYVFTCKEKALMNGVGKNKFDPSGRVTGKQLGAVMLRALGYTDTPWPEVETKLGELGIPIDNVPLTRGRAFDYMWEVINKPITRDGLALGVKLGKLLPEGTTTEMATTETNTTETTKTDETKASETADSVEATLGVRDMPELNMEFQHLVYYYPGIGYSNFMRSHHYGYHIIKKDENQYVTLLALREEKKLRIKTFSKDWQLLKTEEIDFEAPLFGGIYEGKDYYYMAFGDMNPANDDNKTVIKLVKYDKNFNPVDTLDIKNAYTQIPFDGNCSMAETDGYLAIHTGRLRYDGHQTQLTIVVDTDKMRVVNELEEQQFHHVSHSFNQYVFYDEEDRLVLFDHGDAYPRCIVFRVLNKDGRSYYERPALVGSSHSDKERRIGECMLVFPGKAGENITGASIGDVVATNSTYLVGTNRMDYSRVLVGPDSAVRNIYLDVISKEDFSFTSKQITFDAERMANYSEPRIVPIKENRYMLIWEKRYREEGSDGSLNNKKYEVQYVFIDEKATLLTPITTLASHRLYQTDIIYDEGRVYWLGSELADYDFMKSYSKFKTKLYSIDVDEDALK